MAEKVIDVAMESTSQEILSKMGLGISALPVKPISIKAGKINSSSASGTGRCVLFLEFVSCSGTVTIDGTKFLDTDYITTPSFFCLVENSFLLKATTNSMYYTAIFF